MISRLDVPSTLAEYTRYSTSPKAEVYHWIGQQLCHGTILVRVALCKKKFRVEAMRENGEPTDKQTECFGCNLARTIVERNVLINAEHEIRRTHSQSFDYQDFFSISQQVVDLIESGCSIQNLSLTSRSHKREQHVENEQLSGTITYYTSEQLRLFHEDALAMLATA